MEDKNSSISTEDKIANFLIRIAGVTITVATAVVCLIVIYLGWHLLSFIWKLSTFDF